MRRSVVSMGWLVIAVSGCAAMGPRGGTGPDSETWELRRELSRQARQATEARDYPRSLDLLAELAELDTRSPDAPARMGRIFAELGRLDQASEAFQRALDRDGDDIDSLIGLGQIELARGKATDAIARFDEAIEIDPGQATAHIGRGQALEELGRSDEALAAYFRALRHEPDASRALSRVASIQLDRNQPESALARLDHLVELSSEDPEARIQRGRARLALGLTDEAIADLRFASEQLPDRADVAYLLALAFEQADKLRDARLAAERALELDPHSVLVRELAERLHR
ncbi:tetratricopeptide repeat protein [Tautonia rosea]|uniref:tetratricopeptide repeat protein n=1 Tax=Tautonia rosea TaxID=2728037 RepID=UPI0014733B8F|nr:tetratricopeptide repeat protein [Tautonia rosea]